MYIYIHIYIYICIYTYVSDIHILYYSIIFYSHHIFFIFFPADPETWPEALQRKWVSGVGVHGRLRLGRAAWPLNGLRFGPWPSILDGDRSDRVEVHGPQWNS